MSAPVANILWCSLIYHLRGPHSGIPAKIPGNGFGSGRAKKDTVNAPCRNCGSQDMSTYWYDPVTTATDLFAITLCSACARQRVIHQKRNRYGKFAKILPTDRVTVDG